MMFRELNLLPRTIFVLSKFDEFADMENENDYNEKLSIKKENVKNRLHDLINLSNEEIEKLAIVAVSANPFDEGIVYWLENKEEFRKLSHIAQLQDEIENKIIENGGKLALVDNVQKSIVMDILNKQLPVAKELHEAINNGIDKLEDALSIIKDEMNELYYNISQARINLREFTVIYFSGLCDQINGVSLETFNSFVEREIGENGINIDAKVQNEFERQTHRVYGEISKIETNFNQELSFFEKSMLFYGKQGANFLKNSGLINAKNILTGRDVVVKGAKAINWNLDLKFKPWGAMKLANKVYIILIVAGLALEIWDSYKQHQKEKELERVKNKIKENFNRQKDEILSLINDDVKFQEMFFPKVMNLETEIKNIEAAITQFERSARTALLEQQRRHRTNIIKEITELVAKRAQSGGYSMVFDVGADSADRTKILVYTDGKDDLTQDILKQLNANAPADILKQMEESPITSTLNVTDQ